MEPTREAITQNLAERWCWQVVRRNDARVARRLDRKPGVDGVYRLDEGGWLDDFLHCLQELGGVDLLERVRGQAIPRDMVPCVQDSPALWAEAPVRRGAPACAAGVAVPR